MMPPLTPGAYLARRRTAAGRSIEDVAGRLATVPRVAEAARAGQLRLIEADAQPAGFSTIVALRSVYFFDLNVLARLAEIQLGADLPAPRLCSICASSFDNSTVWFERDRCSTCAPPPVQFAGAK